MLSGRCRWTRLCHFDLREERARHVVHQATSTKAILPRMVMTIINPINVGVLTHFCSRTEMWDIPVRTTEAPQCFGKQP